MPIAEIQKAYAHLRQAAGNHPNKEDLLWTVADAITLSAQGAAGVTVGGAVTALKATVANFRGVTPEVTPNPYFVWNGLDDLPSPATKKYISHRASVGLGGAAFAIGGSLASSASVVDVAALTQGSNSLGSTVVHIAKLQGLAKGFKRSDTLNGLLEVVISMKMIKAGMRGGQVVAGVLATGGIASLIAGAASSAAGLGIKATSGNLCVVTAFQLHWRAYQEQFMLANLRGIGAKKGDSGPAMRILQELFARRGLTRIFGKHDIDKIIAEPAGWMAIADKLQAM